MIPREVIDEILSRNDIESLIGSYVSLKRAGSNLKGLCPFHSEKTPSFTVFPKDNSFYCFGCGVGGDAITFIREIEHLDYPDAVAFLAKRVGINVLPDAEASPAGGKKIDKERILQMNVDAAKYYHAALFSENEKARVALRYFTEKRGLSMATIRHFGLGFAPDGFDVFTKYMLSKGYTHEELIAGFLTGKSERGNYYDAFRNRVMFPIIDVSGRVIAFGGRVMDDSQPKYKNSSDTPVFKKTRNLFALNFARQSCAETMILCEGYMDVIAMHAAGFTNAVATLGTAITADQARLMSRYTKKVIISYDADDAGQKAAVRAMRMLGDVGLEVSVFKVPDAKDPDEYIRTFGKDKFRAALEASKSKFEYNTDRVLSKYNLDNPQEKINAIAEMAEMIAGFYSATERDIYVRATAKRFDISSDALSRDVERIVRRNAKTYAKEQGQKIRQETAGFSDRVNADFVKAPTVAKNEESVLGLLLLFPDHRRTVFDENLLSAEDFFTEFNKKVFVFLKNAYESDTDPGTLINENFTPEEIGRLTKIKIARMELTDNGDGVLRDAIAALKASYAKKQAEGTDTYEGLSALLDSIRNRQTDE